TPSSPQRKSKCHQERRNSPSVASRSPHSSCLAMILRISPSSTAFRASGVISPLSRFARACLTGAVRRKLPTWSARKGGLVRCIGGSPDGRMASGEWRMEESQPLLLFAIRHSPFASSFAIHLLPPNLVSHLDDPPQLRPLLVLGQHVAFLGRRE